MCCVLCVLCSLLCVCVLRAVRVVFLCCVLCVAYFVLCDVCGVPCVVGSVLHAMCFFSLGVLCVASRVFGVVHVCVVCCVLCVVCFVLCSVCYVLFIECVV